MTTRDDVTERCRVEALDALVSAIGLLERRPFQPDALQNGWDESIAKGIAYYFASLVERLRHREQFALSANVNMGKWFDDCGIESTDSLQSATFKAARVFNRFLAVSVED
jgi:hypothetical protein